MNEGYFIGSAVALFLVVCVLFEAVVITAFKLTQFVRAFLYSLLVNTISLAVVYTVWPLFRRLNIDEGKAFPLLPILLITTVVVEALVLKGLHRQEHWKRVFVTSAVMNAVSFGVLFLLLSLL